MNEGLIYFIALVALFFVATPFSIMAVSELAAQITIRRELRSLEKVISRETGFIALVRDDVLGRMRLGQEFEDAWEESFERFFPQHYSLAVFDITGGERRLLVDEGISWVYLKDRLRVRAFREALPHILPDI